ncbi:MAG: hypothetical protein J7L43_00520 [Candidatus Aenigmarchaeota archaeon]|nr:hypothetical protein [Candidatus Aenigmarchaeota archaeon]
METTTTINQTLNNALNQNNTLNETNITLTTLPSTTSTILTTTSTIPTTTSTLETTTVPTTLETTTTLNETELPNLVIGVAMPKKIARGQKFSITVSVNNLGGPASGLDVSLLLPDGFNVITYDSDCSALSYGQTCSALFVVNSSLSASLGANNFGVLVRYE